jgi:putative SbcD/Mre11-related phosphoesterase
VALHRPTQTAVVADLHLGYSEARRQSGEAVPQLPLSTILTPLGAALQRTSARRLVIAGDLFESRYARDIATEFVDWLKTRRVELTGVIPGNHDRQVDQAQDLPLYPKGYRLGSWLVIHGHETYPKCRVVVGHWHPCLRWQGRISSPCYLMGSGCVLLPAYSADAAGVNVLGQRAWLSYRCWVIAGKQVLDLGVLGRIAQKLKD